MSLFAAIVPPAAQLAELGRALDALPPTEALGMLRWTDPGSWHITLAFYGEVPDAARPDLERRLGRAATRSRAFDLALAGGTAPRRGPLAVGVAGDLVPLGTLARAARAAGRRAGLADLDRRPYRGHLTLARRRRTAPDPEELAQVARALAGFRSTPWRVREFVLVRSVPPRAEGSGPRHDRLARWPLAG